MNLYLLRGARG